MDTRTGTVMPEAELMKYLGEADFHRYATPAMVDKLTPRKREELRTTWRTKVRCCYGKEPARIIA